MGKRHPNLPAWQWRSNPRGHRSATHQVLDLIALPIMVLAFLLLAFGVFSSNGPSAIIGLLALCAALSLQHQGRTLETDTENSQAF